MSKWSSFKKQQLLTESWRKFVKESEVLGEEQKMPDDFSKHQVVDVVNFLNTEEGSDSKVRAALGAGTADGLPGDEKIEVNENASPDVASLTPTQNEISLIKSIGWPL